MKGKSPALDTFDWKIIMRTAEPKIVKTGGSRGVRVPGKLSWAETAKAMAVAGEDWSEWDAMVSDGLYGD